MSAIKEPHKPSFCFSSEFNKVQKLKMHCLGSLF